MLRRVALVGMVVVAGYVALVRRWQLRWGTPAWLVHAPLPGDEVVDTADLVATRAIRIEAPAAQVWPWVVQLGQGRGGFYSYDALENLIGCDIHSAERIVDAWQHLEVGDEVRLHPEVALRVVHVEAGHALVLEGSVPVTGAASEGSGGEGAAQAPYDFSWAFVVQEAGDGGSWLVVRERYGYRRWWTWLLVEPVAAVSFVMTHRMLRGIRARVEGR